MGLSTSAHRGVPALGRVLILVSLVAGIVLAQEAAQKAYTFHGKVEKVDRKNGKLTVRGEEVAGWMPTMTMAYHIDDLDVLNRIKAGVWIEATVYERDLMLHDVKIVAASDGGRSRQ